MQQQSDLFRVGNLRSVDLVFLQVFHQPAEHSARGDGRLDVLANSPNAELWQNVADREGMYKLINRGTLFKRNISSHTTSPTVVDWNGDGVPDMLVGAEDGFLYYGRNPRK